MNARILTPVGLAVLVVINVLCHAPLIVGEYINADSLYTAAIYRDLFIDGYDISSWNLTPAPSLFPDALVAFPLFAATPHLGIAYITYAALVLFGIAFAVDLITRPLVRNRITAWTAALASVLFLSSLFRYAPYATAVQPLFSMNHHEGAYVIGLLLAGLFLRSSSRGYSIAGAAAFFALAVPMVLSDLFVTTWFLLPIAITSLVGAALRWISPRTAAITCALVAGAHVAANAIGSWLAARGVFQWLDPVGWDSPGHMAARMVDPALARAILDVLLGMPVLGLAVLVLTGVACWLVARRLGDPEPPSPEERSLLLLVAITFIGILGAIASTMAIGRPPAHSVRYLQPLTLLPTSIIAVIAAAACAPRVHRAMVLGVAIFSLATIAATGKRFDHEAFATPYPELARCLDELAESRGLGTGYAGYWSSKPTTLFSRTGVRANAVWKEVDALHICNNDAWLTQRAGAPAGTFPRYEFIAAQRDPPSVGWLAGPAVGEIRALFGPEATRHACGDHDVLVYDRPEDLAFRNRLRISSHFRRAAAVRRMDRPGVANPVTTLPTPDDPPHISQVVCAAGHATWTRNGAGRGTPGIAPVPGQQARVLRFDPERKVDVAEVAARGDHSYRLQFFLADEDLGSVAIPAVAAPMLRARHVAVPATARTRGFDRVLLTPDAPGTSHVGHICFYPDA